MRSEPLSNNRLTFRSWVSAYFVLLLAPVLLLGPLLVRGEALFWGTPSLQFVPWWQYAYDSLRQGVLPLWNPLNGMGAPLLANYQAAFLYPPNWLLLVCAVIGGAKNSAAGIAVGYSLLAIAHLAWAGCGMAMLLRRLGYGWLGQVIGGLAFSLSGYITGRLGFFSMVWVAAWLPWVIYFADHIASPHSGTAEAAIENRKGPVLGLSACLAMQLLAGHAQLSWYTILLAFIWVTAGALRMGGWRRLWKACWRFGISALLAAGIAAVQIVPTFEYLQQSHRADAVAYTEAMAYSFWPWRGLTIFAPDFFGSPARGDFWGYASYWEDHLYMGMLPTILALSTVALAMKDLLKKKRSSHHWMIGLLWAGIAVTFLLAVGKYAPVFPFLYRHVPTFAMFQAPTRYLIWFTFALPLLCAAAIERWHCPTGRGLYWFRLGTAGAFAVTLGAWLAWVFMQGVRLTFIRAVALAGIWALGFGLLTLVLPWAERRGWRRYWQWAVITWVAADLLFAAYPLNPGVRVSFYSAKTAPLPAANGQRVFLGKNEEYDLKFIRFLRFKDFSPIEDWSNMRAALIPNLNLLDGISSANNFDPLVPEPYARWMSAMESLPFEIRQSRLAWANVGWVEQIDIRQPAGIRFDPLEGAQRWHWYTCAVTAGSLDEAWQKFQPELTHKVDADRRIIIEGPVEHGNCPAPEKSVITLIQERPDRIVFVVNTQQAGWLEVMNTWYPGWQVTVDGTPAKLLRADGLFWAVNVTPGNHQLTFYFHPPGFIYAGLFSILVLLFAVLWWTITGRRWI